MAKREGGREVGREGGKREKKKRIYAPSGSRASILPCISPTATAGQGARSVSARWSIGKREC